MRLTIPDLSLVALIGASGSGKSTFARRHFKPAEVIPRVLRLVMDAVDAGVALCVPGNHDVKLLKALRGRDVQLTHGLDRSLAQLSEESDGFRERVAEFIDGLVSHFDLDDGRLVVAHAGMREDMQGRASGAVRAFALYGETTGETDEMGLPVRFDWAREYRGRASVVYGHTPVPDPEWINRTINIDTGCGFGGRLTALRWPEKELVSVAAHATYSEPLRPLVAEITHAAKLVDDSLLHIEDVQGKRIVSTRLRGSITISGENATAALEVMSRFGADPRWLIYLPPTMAPTETSRQDGYLERPEEALAYYEKAGVDGLVCEEKHMGSRAVIVICRSAEAARRRFGVDSDESGICYTRTGRRFFTDATLERDLLERVRDAAGAAGLWDELATDWLCLDCELMPWSLKAQELLRKQYAPVGAAAGAALAAARELVESAENPALSLAPLVAELREREAGPTVRPRLPAVLLAGRVRRRRTPCPFPPARQRRRRPHRSEPPLAFAHGSAADRSRERAGRTDRAPGGRPCVSGESRRGSRLVGGPHGTRR